MDLSKQRVLLTGAHGFLGTHVLKTLNGRNCVPTIFRSNQFDLRNRAEIKFLLNLSKPDVIIHLAATVGGIGANWENPGKFFYDNAIMGIELMEQARLAGVKKFVQIGTICSYPKFTPTPFHEQSLWDGYPEETNAPYGLAKKMLLVQAQAYRQQYGFNAIYLMPTNLYGPGDNFNLQTSHVIPATIRKMLSSEKSITVWGTGSASRDFLYVRDAAEAIVLATEKYDAREPINIGSGVEITIQNLIHRIRAVTGYTGCVEWDESKSDGQPRRLLSTIKAEKYFGFQADTSLLTGLTETVNWYKAQK
jgi:GDP-L-fucose synthase